MSNEDPRPSKRRHIVVATEDQIDAAKNKGEFGIFSRPEILVMPFENPPDFEIVDILERGQLFYPGAFMSQSPFDDRKYYVISDYSHEVSMEKLLLISRLCSYLGAVRLRGIEEMEEEDIAKASAKVEGSVPARGEAGAEIIGSKERRARTKLVLEDEFTGCDPNGDKAMELLHETGLENDPLVRSLLEKASNMENPMKRMNLKVEVNREAKLTMSLLLNVDLPSFLASVRGDISSQASGSRKWWVEIEF